MIARVSCVGRSYSYALAVAALSVASFAAASSAAVTLPFADTFDYPAASVSGTTATTALGTTPYSVTLNSTGTNSAAVGTGTLLVQPGAAATAGTFTNAVSYTLDSASQTAIKSSNFTISSQLTIDAFTASGSVNGGLALFASTAALNATAGYRVFFPINDTVAAVNRKLSIININGGVITSSSNAAVVPTTNTPYTITVNGDYTTTPGSLILSASLATAAGGTLQSVSQTFAAPATGTFFGFRSANTSGQALGLEYDNYSVTVASAPEPASLAAIAGLAGVALRRRRARAC